MIKPVSFSKSLNKFINAAVLRRNQPHMSGFKESEVLVHVITGVTAFLPQARIVRSISAYGVVLFGCHCMAVHSPTRSSPA